MQNKTKQTQMSIPGLNKFKSMTATSSDLKDKVNHLQTEKRQKRLEMNNLQNQINIHIKEIEKLEKKEEIEK